MAVLSFACLKGGVGKTSCSVNVSHAFAKRGCQTLLIDLDPMLHAARLFDLDVELPALSLPKGGLNGHTRDFLLETLGKLAKEVRSYLTVIAGARFFKDLQTAYESAPFRQQVRELLADLSNDFDFIVLDTPPVLSPVVKSALAASDLVVVPVDASAMSLNSLEELLDRYAGKSQPIWAVLRTMVNRQAQRVRALADAQLAASGLVSPKQESPIDAALDSGSADKLLAALDAEGEAAEESDAPVYLLDTVIHRTEQQNRLSFTHQTALDTKGTAQLGEQYLALANELEAIVSLSDENDESTFEMDFAGSAGRE